MMSPDVARGTETVGTGAGTGAGAAVRLAPHSPQNFAPGAFGLPHAAQVSLSGAPHSAQNFRPASFSVPQAEQRIRQG